ncbi:hypothetical protein AVEN_48383-1 [Araneus ventricosus]|uniref:Uncharacterized protein n=1 Tax=Araneus ventricosus TaxID=182803 RepID=A0A4Y2IGJ5_ARAVE|nr:hypothetical protein AVEN_48383-1 [Araneus ventricosus]
MPSTSIAVFFMVLQLTQNIGCHAECFQCNCRKEGNFENTAGKTSSEKARSPLLFVVDVVGAAFAAVNSLTGWIADGLHPAFTGNPFIGKHTNVGGCLCCS